MKQPSRPPFWNGCRRALLLISISSDDGISIVLKFTKDFSERLFGFMQIYLIFKLLKFLSSGLHTVEGSHLYRGNQGCSGVAPQLLPSHTNPQFTSGSAVYKIMVMNQWLLLHLVTGENSAVRTACVRMIQTNSAYSHLPLRWHHRLGPFLWWRNVRRILSDAAEVVRG